MSTTRAYMNAWSKPLLGAVLLGLVGLLLVLNYLGVLGNLFSSSGRTVTAVFADTKTLTKGDPVRVNGVQVGSVEGITLRSGSRTSLVKMSVSPDAGALYANATAAVRWRTVLGGAFYIAINPGNPGNGQLGDQAIPVNHTTSEVELDDVTTMVRGGARTGLQKLPPALAQALSNPHALGNVVTTLSQVSPSLAAGLGALRGQEKDIDLQSLVTNANATVQALDAPDGELKGTVQGAAATLTDIADESTALRETLSTAPTSEAIANRTLTSLNHTLALVNPLVRKLQAPSTQVAPTLVDLQPVVNHANTLLSNATPLLASLRTALPDLATASRNGVPLLNTLSPALSQLENTVLPYLNKVDPATRHSAAEMVGPGLTGLAMAASQEDQNGHFLRFPASSGQSPLYLPCNIYAGDPQAKTLVACDSLQQDLNALLNYNPLAPAPGTATDKGTGTTTTASGN